MPHVQLDAAVAGPLKCHYNISTPTESSAKSIDSHLPTLLFIHGPFIAQETFVAQFNDPNLRRFNLVAFDLRLHGFTEGTVPDNYNPCIAAQDIVLLMDALKLPSSHIFGLSMGSMIALQLAIDHPSRVVSLFLLSPLGLAEPKEVAEGRQAICDAWIEGNSGEQPDEELKSYAVEGGMELVSRDRHSSIMEALLTNVMPQAMTNWDKSHLREYRIATFDFMAKRQPLTKSELAQIKVPVKLVHCLGDVAYPVEYSSEFFRLLEDAGVNVSLDTIPDASHFGCCEDAHLLNPILHDFIMKNVKTEVPDPVEGVSSPWNEALSWEQLQSSFGEEFIVSGIFSGMRRT
ncbi:alpha/beta-hydrolase [Rhodocollybia butyracea]|uniref:Alpha/beta-hydrolase n=1 Tax=Rhodocollybia butyracea TaxID=206335 RepID=A0A9P5QAY4_9AGAR|nr:alpha/beta-hydrolase [Rhodocollybia butyracea]